MMVSILVFCVFFGSAFASPKPKIVNGTDATIEEFPFMVSLRRNNGHSCGGSILNDWWILTAAHCVQSSPEVYSIQYGDTSVNPNSSNVVGVEALYPHEFYDPVNQYINDIALVKLSSPINNNLFDYKVKLAARGSFFSTGTPAVLAGWGRNGTNQPGMTILQKVDLQIYSPSDCGAIHSSPIHPTNVCGGVEGGYQGQCNGDSGGPLMVHGVQVGIVSWSVKPCTVPPFPGVYTAVAHYIDWIQERTGINFRLSMFVQS